MRSFASTLIASVAILVAAHAVDLAAQTPETLYTDVGVREADLRGDLDLAPQLRAQPPGEASAALLRRVRATVAAYEEIVRRFPRSGYCDNALWNAGRLAADAFWQFGDTRDRATALRLFERLKAEYPTSSLLAQIAGQVARLNPTADGAGSLATLRAIRREVLPDALRMTLELEREAVFSAERLTHPARVFIDLQNSQPVDALNDATIAFEDDVVQRARVGVRPDNRTRVVFDVQGTPRYSVYSLYNPNRVVIDFERVTGQNTKAALPTKDARTPAPGPAASPQPVGGTNVLPPAAPTANAAGGFSLSRQLGLGVARVVIDPGHGGHDPGAQVPGLNEADLVLDIALRLERRLAGEPGVDVVLTRRTNAYVALEERTAIANRSGADLFLSIHANASANANVRGFETYYLNFAPNPEAEALAARENAGSSRTMGNLPDIVKAIALNNKIDESRDFAGMVQAAMQSRLLVADRKARNLGVRQAPFMVLIGATMPSVLVEVSFLTNRDEAALLRSQNYRQQVAEALEAGVMKYQRSLKTTSIIAAQEPTSTR